MTRTFRVVAVLVLGWTLVGGVIGLVEPALMALPSHVIADLPDFELEHRTQLAGTGLLTWLAVVGVAVQLRRPQRHVAAMLLASALALGGLFSFGLWGTWREWLAEDVTVAAPILLLAALHPGVRQLGRPGLDPATTVLAVAGAAGWLAYAVAQLDHQLTGSGTAVSHEHWAAMAALGLALAASGMLGATDWPGWQVPGAAVAIATAYLAIHALVFPGLPSALATAWAVAALGWSAAYATALVRRHRRSSTHSSV